MTLENFKLAVLSEEFTDEAVQRLFLDVEVGSEADIREVAGILKAHRPRVLQKLSHAISRKKPAG